MKATLIAATLALALAAPFAAPVAAPFATMADDDPPATEAAAATIDTEPGLPADAGTHAKSRSGDAQFVGPFEMHNGLLPNGLLPAPVDNG